MPWCAGGSCSTGAATCDAQRLPHYRRRRAAMCSRAGTPALNRVHPVLNLPLHSQASLCYSPTTRSSNQRMHAAINKHTHPQRGPPGPPHAPHPRRQRHGTRGRCLQGHRVAVRAQSGHDSCAKVRVAKGAAEMEDACADRCEGHRQVAMAPQPEAGLDACSSGQPQPPCARAHALLLLLLLALPPCSPSTALMLDRKALPRPWPCSRGVPEQQQAVVALQAATDQTAAVAAGAAGAAAAQPSRQQWACRQGSMWCAPQRRP